MRKLIGLVVVLALLAGVLAIVDVVVRRGVEAAVADRIQSQLPGSEATVTISSFPFLGHLAASGTVPSLQAKVTGVTDGGLSFSRIDLQLEDLKVDRTKLEHRDVEALSLARGQVLAVISQASLDAATHLPLSLGSGTIGAAGVKVRVHLRIVRGTLVVGLGPSLPALHVTVPRLDILPCVGAAQIVPGALRLSCHFTTLPGLLKGATYHF